MTLAAWRWSMLLCWPVAAGAGDVALRVMQLSAAPHVAAGSAVLSIARSPATVAGRAWLHAPYGHVAWYELQLVDTWRAASPPLLSIRGNTRARVVAYLPPDYRARSDTTYDASLDPTFSHHAVVYRLPPDLRAGQPIYVELGDPGQAQPIRVGISDEASYRVADLAYVRANTFFISVQLSMVLVISCFWLVLRDRVFLHFMAYASAEILYELIMSGELFALPGAGLWTRFGFRLVQSMAPLATAFSIWFLLDFVGLRRSTPRLARALRVLAWASLVCVVLLWMPLPNTSVWVPSLFNPELLGACTLALAAASLAWWRGNRQAGFFLLSWVPLLALAIVRVVQLTARWPLPGWLEFGFLASMAWADVIITAGLADRMLEVRRERDDATRMAQFDPLTGVFNRRAIMDRLHQAWQATAVAPEPLAVLFLDIDHFKRINDSRGHAAGDACLCAVTAAIRAELGKADRVGRYGGEEFLVMLRGDSARMARHVAERIVARAAALRVPVGEPAATLTVSIGVAMRDAQVVDVEALVEYADTAQYQAKAEGRNRVVVQQREAVSTFAATR